MTQTVIIVSSYDPQYLRITEHLVLSAIKSGRTPLVLDISDTLAAPVDSYHRGTLRLFGLKFPGYDMVQRLSQRGATVIPIREVVANSAAVKLGEDVESELEISIQSALMTFFRTELPDPERRSIRRIRSRLDFEGRAAYRGISEVLGMYPGVTEVVVPNGRFPHQRMATRAAQDSGVPTMHFEKGETPEGAYFQPYAPQSRILSQASVSLILGNRSREEVESVADAWLAHRIPSEASRNEFSVLWGDSLPSNFPPEVQSGRVAGFFTSSQDEYYSLGPEWQKHSWESQFEAFDHVLSRLDQLGYFCYLRVHPNLATKAHASYKRERERIMWLSRRHPGLLVIWHDNFANTYSLLDHTDSVFVWDSTIGLEASARGIPVWNMAVSRYGLTADTRELLSPLDVTDAALTPWNVDAHSAKRFIAYMVLRDSQMDRETEPWAPWGESKLPFGAKLSRVLVSGGNPTIWTAIQSLVDVYRHRSARSNFRSIMNR